jgi:hypothetical protein
MKNLQNLLNKFKKEIEDLKQTECDIHRWSKKVPELSENDKNKLLEIETQKQMIEEFIECIDDVIKNIDK